MGYKAVSFRGCDIMGSVAVTHGHSCSYSIWKLLEAGIEPASPALAGGFYPLRHQGGLDGSNFLLSLDELRSSSLSQEREETGKLDLKCNTAVEMALSS